MFLNSASMSLEPMREFKMFNSTLTFDTFTNNDAEYWAKRAELEQRCRELLVRYPDKAAGKASILDDLTEEMGGGHGEFAGASIDVVGEKDDSCPSTVISLADKKWGKPKRYGLLESLSANTRFGQCELKKRGSDFSKPLFSFEVLDVALAFYTTTFGPTAFLIPFGFWWVEFVD